MKSHMFPNEGALGCESEAENTRVFSQLSRWGVYTSPCHFVILLFNQQHVS